MNLCNPFYIKSYNKMLTSVRLVYSLIVAAHSIEMANAPTIVLRWALT